MSIVQSHAHKTKENVWEGLGRGSKSQGAFVAGHSHCFNAEGYPFQGKEECCLQKNP